MSRRAYLIPSARFTTGEPNLPFFHMECGDTQVFYTTPSARCCSAGGTSGGIRIYCNLESILLVLLPRTMVVRYWGDYIRAGLIRHACGILPSADWPDSKPIPTPALSAIQKRACPSNQDNTQSEKAPVDQQTDTGNSHE